MEALFSYPSVYGTGWPHHWESHIETKDLNIVWFSPCTAKEGHTTNTYIWSKRAITSFTAQLYLMQPCKAVIFAAVKWLPMFLATLLSMPLQPQRDWWQIYSNISSLQHHLPTRNRKFSRKLLCSFPNLLRRKSSLDEGCLVYAVTYLMKKGILNSNSMYLNSQSRLVLYNSVLCIFLMPYYWILLTLNHPIFECRYFACN